MAKITIEITIETPEFEIAAEVEAAEIAAELAELGLVVDTTPEIEKGQWYMWEMWREWPENMLA